MFRWNIILELLDQNRIKIIDDLPAGSDIHRSLSSTWISSWSPQEKSRWIPFSCFPSLNFMSVFYIVFNSNQISIWNCRNLYVQSQINEEMTWKIQLKKWKLKQKIYAGHTISSFCILYIQIFFSKFWLWSDWYWADWIPQIIMCFVGLREIVYCQIE